MYGIRYARDHFSPVHTEGWISVEIGEIGAISLILDKGQFYSQSSADYGSLLSACHEAERRLKALLPPSPQQENR